MVKILSNKLSMPGPTNAKIISGWITHLDNDIFLAIQSRK